MTDQPLDVETTLALLKEQTNALVAALDALIVALESR